MCLTLVVSSLSQDFTLPTGSLVLGGMLQWKTDCLPSVRTISGVNCETHIFHNAFNQADGQMMVHNRMTKASSCVYMPLEWILI